MDKDQSDIVAVSPSFANMEVIPFFVLSIGGILATGIDAPG